MIEIANAVLYIIWIIMTYHNEQKDKKKKLDQILIYLELACIFLEFVNLYAVCGLYIIILLLTFINMKIN